MRNTQRSTQKGVNSYERRELINKTLVLGASILILTITLVSLRDKSIAIHMGVAAIFTIFLIVLSKQIISTYKRTFIVFDDIGVIFNGKRVKYNELIAASTYHIKIIQDKSNRHSRTYWTEEYYYRCFSLDFKVKDILIGYFFEESSMGLNEISDKIEVQNKMNGYCETYRNNEPYLYKFSEDDFHSLYTRIKKLGLEINSIRK